MALINCPSCGKQISDMANTCVHCGYALKQPQPEAQPEPAFEQPAAPAPEVAAPAKKPLSPEAKKKRLIIIAAIALVVIIAVVLIIVLSKPKKEGPASEPASVAGMVDRTGFSTEDPETMNIVTKTYTEVKEDLEHPENSNFFVKVVDMARPGD